MSTRLEIVKWALILSIATTALADVAVVRRPETSQESRFYVGNRKPLAPSPLIKLPIKSIQPRGWLRKQLELQARGFTGHLTGILECSDTVPDAQELFFGIGNRGEISERFQTIVGIGYLQLPS